MRIFPDKLAGNQGSHGFTLIEFMIVLGIIGVLALGVSRFSQTFEQSQAKSDARNHSNEANRQLVSLIQRDMRFQTAYQVLNNQLSLQITRRQHYNPNSPNDTYQVTYRSECAAPPNAISAFFGEVYSNANLQEVINRPENTCLNRLACPAGRYPRIQILAPNNTNGGRIPEYSVRLYPDFASASQQDGVRRGPVGSAACFLRAGNRLRVITHSIFLTGRDGNRETVQVISDEALLSASNVAGVEIIPNN